MEIERLTKFQLVKFLWKAAKNFDEQKIVHEEGAGLTKAKIDVRMHFQAQVDQVPAQEKLIYSSFLFF